MYVGSYAICVLNWNWWLTQDHFLIRHWSQRTHRCSARVVGLEACGLDIDLTQKRLIAADPIVFFCMGIVVYFRQCWSSYTTHPKKYAHGLRFDVVCCSSVSINVTHIHQGYFSDTGSSVWVDGTQKMYNEMWVPSMITFCDLWSDTRGLRVYDFMCWSIVTVFRFRVWAWQPGLWYYWCREFCLIIYPSVFVGSQQTH